jgi:hypothetical protein
MSPRAWAYALLASAAIVGAVLAVAVLFHAAANILPGGTP